MSDIKFPGNITDWNGFTHYTFELDGVECQVACPAETAPGRPWIWRMRFFGGFPTVDLALLKLGWHVAYTDIAEIYAGPEALKRMDRLYNFMTGEMNFPEKPVLEGFSRGGIPLYAWASRNPQRVSCLYGDAPVCDFKSWPAGKGSGPGTPECWQNLLKAYGYTEEDALGSKENPIDVLEPIAQARIPIIHVVGDLDEPVPVAENTAILEERYKALGGDITVIHKPDCGHHPHSLEDPTPVVDFLLKHSRI